MLVSIGLVIVGLVLLAGGGEVLLRGAVGLARRLDLTPAVIGLTVVAAGTSVPELAVSVLASLRDNTDIAVANVIGSNIFNATAILGLAAIIAPLAVTGNMIRLEYPVAVLITLMCVAVADDGVINRKDAAVFLATYVGFTAYLVSIVREHMQRGEREQLDGQVEDLTPSSESVPLLSRSILYITVGVVLLAAGAEATVRGAVELGRLLGLSERIIGLTIVAAGTSLPEVVTSVIAAMRGRDDIAIGNIIGSNLFNILVILGTSALVAPLQVAPEIRDWDLYWALGTILLLFPLMRSSMRIQRGEGALLLGVYGLYLFFLF